MLNSTCAAALLGLALLTACADRNSPVMADNNPKPPITRGDGDTFSTQPLVPPSDSVAEARGGGGGGNPAPEPVTILLVGTGLAGAALYSRIRRKLGIANDVRN